MLFKKFFVILILITVPVYLFSYGVADYFGHCNLSIGPNLWLGGDRTSNDDVTALNFSSNRKNHYTFYFDSSAIEQKAAGAAFNLRFPFYYNDLFSLGPNMEICGNAEIMQANFGLYFNYHFTEIWSAVADSGCALTAYDQVIGSVGGKDIKVSALGPSFTAGLGAKFHITEYFYLEAGYRFVWAPDLGYYTVYHDKDDLGEPKIPSISINHSNHFSIKIGIGI